MNGWWLVVEVCFWVVSPMIVCFHACVGWSQLRSVGVLGLLYCGFLSRCSV